MISAIPQASHKRSLLFPANHETSICFSLHKKENDDTLEGQLPWLFHKSRILVVNRHSFALLEALAVYFCISIVPI